MSEAMRAAAIERAAEGEGDMPESLTAPEQMLFLSLRLLSRLENWKIIPEERAGREKTKIKNQFRLNEFNCRMWEESAQRNVRIEKAMREVRGDPRLMREPKVVALISTIDGIRREATA